MKTIWFLCFIVEHQITTMITNRVLFNVYEHKMITKKNEFNFFKQFFLQFDFVLSFLF